MIIRKICVFGMIVIMTGCSKMSVEDFANGTPEFRFEEYFAGPTKAWGIFEDRNGNVRSEFVVDINGTWDGKQLTLTEDFIYADGETENRVWTILKTGDATYTGRTENSVGEASGRRAGNAFNWRYDFNLQVGDDTWKVSFDDWMFLQPDGVLLNKATVSRWGIKIGTVFISFQKPAIPDIEIVSSNRQSTPNFLQNPADHR